MEWLKKLLCNIWFYIILIIVSLVAPFIINELYKYGQAKDIGYLTLWGAEDVFAFLGDYLSFFGTIVLGAAAVFQNERANKLAENANNQTDTANELANKALAQAEKANELSLQMHRLEQARFYSVVSLGNFKITERSVNFPNYVDRDFPNPKVFDLVDAERLKCHNCYHVDFIIKNESEFPIDFINVKCRGRFQDANYGLKEAKEAIYVAPSKEHSIRLVIPATYFVQHKEYDVKIDIFYQNVFGYETHVQLSIEDISQEYNPQYTYQFQRIWDTPKAQNEDK